MKSTLALLALVFCSHAFAASSVCEVFVTTNSQSGAQFGYEVFTTCDGKKLSETPITGGISEAYTAGLHALLAAGYNLFSCTMENTNEGNSSVAGTYDCLLTR